VQPKCSAPPNLGSGLNYLFGISRFIEVDCYIGSRASNSRVELSVHVRPSPAPASSALGRRNESLYLFDRLNEHRPFTTRLLHIVLLCLYMVLATSSLLKFSENSLSFHFCGDDVKSVDAA
jgi:hypothetical protein